MKRAIAVCLFAIACFSTNASTLEAQPPVYDTYARGPGNWPPNGGAYPRYEPNRFAQPSCDYRQKPYGSNYGSQRPPQFNNNYSHRPPAYPQYPAYPVHSGFQNYPNFPNPYPRTPYTPPRDHDHDHSDNSMNHPWHLGHYLFNF